MALLRVDGVIRTIGRDEGSGSQEAEKHGLDDGDVQEPWRAVSNGEAELAPSRLPDVMLMRDQMVAQVQKLPRISTQNPVNTPQWC